MHELNLTEGSAEELIAKIRHQDSTAEKIARWKREASDENRENSGSKSEKKEEEK